MKERGVVVDHSSIKRWAIRFLPVLEKACRKHKHAVSTSWSMDETYITVNGTWKDLYRAVDKHGQTVDFLLTPKRDAAATRYFFEKAIRHSTVPDKVTMDKSGTDQAALEQVNKQREIPMTILQVRYLNYIVERDHRAIKRITRPMLGSKSFRAVRDLGERRTDAYDSQMPVRADGSRHVVCRLILVIGRTTPSGVRSRWANPAPVRLALANATQPLGSVNQIPELAIGLNH